MKPGRDLDALVATEVMGISKEQINEWLKCYGEYSYSFNEVYKFPYYSTEIEFAWLVVEKANIESVIRLESGGWVANVVGRYAVKDDKDSFAWPRINEYYETSLYEDSVIIGETAAHAICLAALKAVGVEI